ncbi:MAG0920 family protein [Metamycoplasma orale]|uniref:Uncharacterized protein n=1 Tax=Metamycoplasma orale TaxID=2121 RepID=A0A448ZWR8_METOS|nr:hypothetical protein [Metamycoplasma orale]VEU55708.1 Uncharacterised protein [Metamycoplasma orale]
MTNYILYSALGIFILNLGLNSIIEILFFINYKYFYIGFSKLNAKQYFVENSIRVNSLVFQIFEKLFKKFRNIFISIIVVFSSLLFVCFAYAIVITIKFWPIIKNNLLDYLLMYGLIFVDFIFFAPIYYMPSLLRKWSNSKLILKNWKEINNNFQEKDLEIENVAEYEKFKNLILYKEVIFEYSYEKNNIKQTFVKWFMQNKRPFLDNGNIDKNKIIEFLICDYQNTKLDYVSYPFSFYLKLIKEFS